MISIWPIFFVIHYCKFYASVKANRSLALQKYVINFFYHKLTLFKDVFFRYSQTGNNVFQNVWHKSHVEFIALFFNMQPTSYLFYGHLLSSLSASPLRCTIKPLWSVILQSSRRSAKCAIFSVSYNLIVVFFVLFTVASSNAVYFLGLLTVRY